MKHLSNLCLALLISLASCKKEDTSLQPQPSTASYIAIVQASLRDSLSPEDYSSLDFARSSASGIRSMHIKMLRIPLTSKSIATDFLVIKTDEAGHIITGRFIHISKDTTERKSFTGTISYRTLKGKRVMQANFNHGHVERNQGGRASQLMAEEPEWDGGDLPPVVVTYSPSGGGFTYADWYNLIEMAGDDGYNYGSYYTPASGGGGGGSSSAPAEQVDFEAPESKEAIDVNKYIKCFGTTQPASADYTITIAVDLPVDSDPSKFFNWSDASPGHTFIEFYKNGDGGLVQQNIGFYPNTSWKTVVGPDNIASKIADDGGHEYQAKYTIVVSPSQFQQAMNAAKTYSTHDYNVAEFNCADYALQIFKAAGGSLNVPQLQIPGFPSSDGSNTPEGVYDAIQSLVLSGNKNAVANGQKQWIGDSHGACD